MQCTGHAMSAVILAGGKGSRLYQVTEMAMRPKPAVPFGSKLRLIDFAVNNAVNSGINHTWVLTQYYGSTVQDYLYQFDYESAMYDKFVRPVAPQHAEHGKYCGTANAVYQNIRLLENDPCDVVAILAADHIYKIDLRQMCQYHEQKGSLFTVCCTARPRDEAKGFGVMAVDEHYRIQAFQEKPEDPASLPGDDGMSLCSMGVYLVNKEFLIDILREDHADEESSHDFGKDIIPKLLARQEALYGYNFEDNEVPGENDRARAYWRDVGTPYAYWEAQMDLVAPEPQLNLYNHTHWPIRSVNDRRPPAKDVFPEKERYKQEFENNLFLPDRIAAGGCVFDSPKQMHRMICGRDVRTGWGYEGVDSILYDGVHIGSRVKMLRTIVEEGVHIPDNARIGFDIEEDVANGIVLGIGKEEFANKAYISAMDHDKIIRIVTRNHKL